VLSSVTLSVALSGSAHMTQMHQSAWVNGTVFVRDDRLGIVDPLGRRFTKIPATISPRN